MRENEELLRKVFAAAAGLGDVPVVILGDINVPPEASSAVSSALMTEWWIDAASAIAAAFGSAPDATCFVQDTSVGSRLDVIFCNSVAGALLVDFGLVADCGLPVHFPVACAFRWEAAVQHVRKVEKGRR